MKSTLPPIFNSNMAMHPGVCGIIPPTHTDGFNGHSARLGDINLKILPTICLYLFKRFRHLGVGAGRETRRGWQSGGEPARHRRGRTWMFHKQCRLTGGPCDQMLVFSPHRVHLLIYYLWHGVNLRPPAAVAPTSKFLGGFPSHRR